MEQFEEDIFKYSIRAIIKSNRNIEIQLKQFKNNDFVKSLNLTDSHLDALIFKYSNI